MKPPLRGRAGLEGGAHIRAGALGQSPPVPAAAARYSPPAERPSSRPPLAALPARRYDVTHRYGFVPGGLFTRACIGV
ncbi:Hypothetical protein NTJ_14723 [Nesidiocoris tenuis]|uniref:Uncharacterized protein n=1 Tax=Nesidiocoris tenuis TaxID=355587 RepID=A0ABN7BC00_9HEMI|nr:Hypothetical protein NTJ_14723 [Nesidiocoris tenuis]